MGIDRGDEFPALLRDTRFQHNGAWFWTERAPSRISQQSHTRRFARILRRRRHHNRHGDLVAGDTPALIIFRLDYVIVQRHRAKSRAVIEFKYRASGACNCCRSFVTRRGPAEYSIVEDVRSAIVGSLPGEM